MSASNNDAPNNLPTTAPRVALITGAAGGIGGATAERFLRDGWAVGLCDMDAARLTEVRAALDPQGDIGSDRLLEVAVDLRAVVGCERAIRSVVAWAGRLDCVVNAAGVWTEGASDEVTEDEWDRVLDINLKATFFVCRYAIPALERVNGCIVNLSSDAGLFGNKGAAVYSASKGGVSLLTRALAVELAERGVRVNAVCPGDVDTPMIQYQANTFGKGDPAAYLRGLLAHYPQGERARFIRPTEIAALIAYLVSPEAAPITGACISIDFGLTAGY
jgi:NAD(P)-dependent dehydrogenase (short-subunit alcohol dehydrogenase family)